MPGGGGQDRTGPSHRRVRSNFTNVRRLRTNSLRRRSHRARCRGCRGCRRRGERVRGEGVRRGGGREGPGPAVSEGENGRQGSRPRRRRRRREGVGRTIHERTERPYEGTRVRREVREARGGPRGEDVRVSGCEGERRRRHCHHRGTGRRPRVGARGDVGGADLRVPRACPHRPGQVHRRGRHQGRHLGQRDRRLRDGGQGVAEVGARGHVLDRSGSRPV